MVTRASSIVTRASWSEGLAENGDLVLFEALVREYCGVGFFECLNCPESAHQTSTVWEESASRPPVFFRTIIELLHRAVEQESER